MQNKIGIIYGLIDPRYGIIRYVGQTISSIEERFKRHINELRLNRNTKKDCWLRKLEKIGLRAIPITLKNNICVSFIETVNGKNIFDYSQLDFEEKYFISITKEECCLFKIDCVNGTNGGGGKAAANVNTNKCKIVSNETRQKMRNAKLGRLPWNTGLTKETDKRVKKSAEYVKNVVWTEEKRIEYGKTRTGNKSPRFKKLPWNKGLTKETSSIVANYGNRKISSEQKDELFKLFLNGETYNSLSIKYNCHPATIKRHIKDMISKQ
jgi:Uri superfamily endonuclease